jgi:YVTN family beta-propeller protein
MGSIESIESPSLSTIRFRETKNREHVIMKVFGAKSGFVTIVIGLTLPTWSYAQDRDVQSTEAALGGNQDIGYVVMNGSNTIGIIDIGAKEIVGKIPVLGNPHGGAITPDGKYIYTSSMGANEIFVVDTRARKVVDSIDVGSISHHSAIGPNGRYLYVAAKDVVVIDTETNEVIARIATKEPPFYPEFAPNGRFVYVLNMGSTVTVIDPSKNTVIDTIKMDARSMMGHLAFDYDGRELYVTNDVDNMVSVIDSSLNKVVAVIEVGKGPHGVATTLDHEFVYVANRGETTLSIIQTSSKKVVATYEVGNRPEHLTLTPDGRYIFLSINTGSDRILVIDPRTSEVVKRIPGWPAAHAFLFYQPSSMER